MSSEYSSTIPYLDVINLFVDEMLILSVEPPIFTNHHKLLKYKGNNIFVINEDGLAHFTRYGSNNPTHLFNFLLEKFPGTEIIDVDVQMNWPECGGYNGN